jgi:hypothetical protein
LAADGTRHCSAYHSIVTKPEAKATFRFTRTAEENTKIENKLDCPAYHSIATKQKATVTFRFAETMRYRRWNRRSAEKRIKNNEIQVQIVPLYHSTVTKLDATVTSVSLEQ